MFSYKKAALISLNSTLNPFNYKSKSEISFLASFIAVFTF